MSWEFHLACYSFAGYGPFEQHKLAGSSAVAAEEPYVVGYASMLTAVPVLFEWQENLAVLVLPSGVAASWPSAGQV